MAVTSLSVNHAVGGRTAAASPSSRILGATIACISRWGMAKTTLDDIAREAGVSRATVYRLFPGGKDTVVKAAVAAELEAFAQGLVGRLTGLESLEDLVVATLTYATTALRQHPALQYLLQHEPGQVLPHLAFANFDEVLAAAAAMGSPWLAPHLGRDDADPAAEWVARLICSYTLSPSVWYDLGDDDGARRFTRRFLLPGLVRKAHDHG